MKLQIQQVGQDHTLAFVVSYYAFKIATAASG